tara:strand:- start:44 stop:574 length:531 start_codon:yes stop_codon:yes gene_type:complete
MTLENETMEEILNELLNMTLENEAIEEENITSRVGELSNEMGCILECLSDRLEEGPVFPISEEDLSGDEEECLSECLSGGLEEGTVFPISEEYMGISGESCISGCLYGGRCLPMGVRRDDRFCSTGLKLTYQMNEDQSCDNNFECSSNVCIAGECVSEGLLKKMLNWFINFFGGGR